MAPAKFAREFRALARFRRLPQAVELEIRYSYLTTNVRAGAGAFSKVGNFHFCLHTTTSAPFLRYEARAVREI